MKVDRPNLRKEFNAAMKCEWCGKKSPQGCDCCHLFTKGAGQVDVRCNLFAGHRLCHSSIEGKKPAQESMIRLIAKREDVRPDAIEDSVQFWRRLPKNSLPSLILSAALAELSADALVLVMRDVDEMVLEGFWSTGNVSS